MKQRGAKATSLKAKIKNIAKEKRVAPQLILQNFMMERFLNRIATSSYKDCFIIKGGSLISVILGIENRTTMDIDMTSRGFSFNEKNVQGIIQDISLIDLQDDYNGAPLMRQKTAFNETKLKRMFEYEHPF